MDTALLVALEGNACDALYHHHHHSRRNCRHRSRPYDQFVYVPGKEEVSPKGGNFDLLSHGCQTLPSRPSTPTALRRHSKCRTRR